MPDLETARMLLTMAAKDLQVLTILADAEYVPVEAFGFHAQQAVEKALKAWLSILGKEHPRTHSLRMLILLLEKSGVIVDSLWDFAELSPFAIQFRYESLGSMDVDFDLRDWMGRVYGLVDRVQSVLREQEE